MELDKVFLFFSKYIESELGIIYAEHNYYQLQNRLEEIAKTLGLNCVGELYQLAQKGIEGTCKQLLLDVSTNNETSFFRDGKIFSAIESDILPEMSKKNTKLRIWSAASSSGQEAISLTILIKEWCLKNKKNIDFSITATDISNRILARAKEAEYSELEVQRGLTPEYLSKYFTKNINSRYKANADLMSHIHLKRQNLIEPFSLEKGFQMILCRNVLIYQNVTKKIEILNRITQMLDEDGILILGSGESLLGISSDYTQMHSHGAVFYVKKNHLKLNVA